MLLATIAVMQRRVLAYLSLSQQVDANAFGKPNQCVWQAGEIWPHQHARGGGARAAACNRFCLFRPFCSRAASILALAALCAPEPQLYIAPNHRTESRTRSRNPHTLEPEPESRLLRCVEISLSASPPITSWCVRESDLCNSITAAVTIAHNERQSRTHFSCSGAHVNKHRHV